MTDDSEKSKAYSRTYSNLGRDKGIDDDKEKSKGYARSYTTLGRSKAYDDKEKEPSPPKRLSTRYSSSKDLSEDTKSRLTSNYSTARKEEKGPPITFNTRYKSTPTRARSRDPSPTFVDNQTTQQTAVQRLTAARNLSRDPSPTSNVSAYSRLSSTRSRDPSPVSKSYTGMSQDKTSINKSCSNRILGSNDRNDTTSSYLGSLPNSLEKTYSSKLSTSRDPSPGARSSILSSFPRSRDPSPVENKYRSMSSYRLSSERASRDASPSITLNKPKIRESSPVTYPKKIGSASSCLSSTASLNNYGSKTTRVGVPQNKTPDISISYMTSNETRASRVNYVNRHSPHKDKLDLPSMIPLRTESPKCQTVETTQKQPENDTESEESSSSSEETDDDSSEENAKIPETKIMIQVTTITRATSPNPCSATHSRTRRIEVAKTIEKVRQRPLQGPPTFDKSTQSDRMDDSTRNARYGVTSRSTYSPFSRSPTNYTPRTTSSLSTSRYSREPSETVSAAESDKSEPSEKTSQKSDKFNFALPKSEEESSVKSDSTKGSLSSKMSSDNQKVRVSISKSKTPDSTKLPPQSPTKSESPKSVSSKVSNKDFRKSALNMGPTDRLVRKSKSSSSENSSPTVEKTRLQFQEMLNGDTKNQIPIERSSSVDSESSTESVDVDSQIERQIKSPTKEEIICHKVEEAKTFLLKTLGNSAAYNSLKTSSSVIEANDNCETSESCSTKYPTQTHSANLDFSSLQKTESGEKAWWMDETNKVQENASDENANQEEVVQIVSNFSDMTLKTSNGFDETQKTKWPWLETKSLNEKLQKIQRVKSGEKAWWCTSPENKTISENHALAQNPENTRNMWEQETQADISEIQRDDEFRENEINHQIVHLSQLYNNLGASQLGDRASPEGLESQRISLNCPVGKVFREETLQNFNGHPRLFISRHTNIDDLLGKSL